MRALVRAAALVLAAATLGASAAEAGPQAAPPAARHRALQGPSLLPNGDFRHGVEGWASIEDADLDRQRDGRARDARALRVQATRPSDAGALAPVARVPPGTAPDTVTVDALRGRFSVVARVRALGGGARKRFRLQLNESGGLLRDKVLGGTAQRHVRLTRRWQRVTTTGTVKRRDRSTVIVLAVLEKAKAGDAFLLDDVRVVGPPPRPSSVAAGRRWRLWNYVVLWTLVVAGGALLALQLRRRGRRAAPGASSEGVLR